MAGARALRATAPREAVRLLEAAKDDPGWDHSLSPWEAGDYVVEGDGSLGALWRELTGRDDPGVVQGGLVADYVCASERR